MNRRLIALIGLLGVVLVATPFVSRRANSPHFALLQEDFREGLSRDEHYLYDMSDFERLPKPEPGEWLDIHPELGQSFMEYRAGNPIQRTEKRKSIVFLPLGPFDAKQQAVLEKTADFCQRFFACEVRVDPPFLDLDAEYSRQHQDGTTQFQTAYLLDKVLPARLPEDAICLLGVTMYDLYPGEDWNFVFGQAKVKGRVGVFSMVRYQGDSPKMMLRRSCMTMAHESAHMFSMHHCIWFRCLMQGSDSLNEVDGKPMNLCLICLRKLHWNLKFDIAERYRSLLEFMEREGLDADAEWVRGRLGN